MTKLAMIILVALATCTSCKTISPSNVPFDDSLLMNIDCRNETGTRQTIVMLLRTNRARDICGNSQWCLFKYKSRIPEKGTSNQ